MAQVVTDLAQVLSSSFSLSSYRIMFSILCACPSVMMMSNFHSNILKAVQDDSFHVVFGINALDFVE